MSVKLSSQLAGDQSLTVLRREQETLAVLPLLALETLTCHIMEQGGQLDNKEVRGRRQTLS